MKSEKHFSYNNRTIFNSTNCSFPVFKDDILYLQGSYYKVSFIVKYPVTNIIEYHLEFITLELE